MDRDRLAQLRGLTGLTDIDDIREALLTAKAGVVVNAKSYVKGISSADLSRTDDIYTLME